MLSAVVEQWRRQARADRQSGAMPMEVRERDDTEELWGAFRSHVGTAWTGQRSRDFIAGWDARGRNDA